MFLQSKISVEDVASATTIQVNSDLVRLTGSTQIETIHSKLKLSIQGGVMIFLVPVDGSIVLGTSGNILSINFPITTTLLRNGLYVLAYSAKVDKWYVQGTPI